MGRASRRKNQLLPLLQPQGSGSGSRVFLLIGLGISALGMWMVWREWDVHNRSVETSAVVVDRRINNSPGGSDNSNTYRPELLLRYSIGDRRFYTWADVDSTAVGSGLTGEALAKAKIDAYTKGESYPCWYDPDHPEHVVLVRGYSWSWYLGFGVVAAGLLVAALGRRFRSVGKQTAA